MAFGGAGGGGLLLYEQEALHFHFALGPANYVADPAHSQVPEVQCTGS